MLPKKIQVEIDRVWNELTLFSAADGDAALEFVLQATARLVDADDATWAGAVRLLHGPAADLDAKRGWRTRAVRMLDRSAERRKASARALKAQGTPGSLLTGVALARRAGKFRGVRLRHLVDIRKFEQTPQYRWYYRRLGIADRMWVSFPLNAHLESHFIFDRRHRDERFTRRDLEIACAMFLGLRWFHRQTMLRHGLLLAKHPLSPTQQQVLSLLLTDASEKQIAGLLAQSFHTTHTHVREIFRRFGVTGRAGLMAIWLMGG